MRSLYYELWLEEKKNTWDILQQFFVIKKMEMLAFAMKINLIFLPVPQK